VGGDNAGRNILRYFEDNLGICMKHVKINAESVSAYSIVIVRKDSQEKNGAAGERIIIILGRAPLDRIDTKSIEQYDADWVVLSSLGKLAMEAYDYIAKKTNLSLLSILGKNEIEEIKKGRLKLPAELKTRPNTNSILVLNKEEFESLQDQYDMLSSAYHEIVVTDGPGDIVTNCDQSGKPLDCDALYPGDWLRIPAAEADVVDTSGAGDLFCAGYLNARRLNVERPDAVKFASIVSSFGISQYGAHTGVSMIQKIKVDTYDSVLQCVRDDYKVTCVEVA
jgi:sugar/nucleoside kinase (ribokinase family)